MTTSLATLASNPLAHSSSTVIMSTQQNQSNNTTTMNNQYQQYSSQQQQQQTLIESGEYDSSQETKTEFYTREGLWKLVKNGEFVRQQQQQQNNNGYQMNQVSNNYGNNNNSNNNGMTNGQMPNTNQTTNNSNEPVKVAFFNYSNDLIQTNQNNKFKLKNYCIKCMKIIISNQQKRIEKSNNNNNNNNNNRSTSDHDDDDDIVYFNNDNDNNNTIDNTVCKYCNAKLNSNDSLSLSNTSINNNNNNSLDVVVFNYAREIYFYEFNPFNKTKSSSDMKNLIDKKVYRSFISTCFDINLLASNLNTLDLQNKSVQQNKTDLLSNDTNSISSNTTTTMSSMSTGVGMSSGNVTTKMNLSPSYLSLIIAAGFSKGEIHVFDGFKKEASVFYNNNKLVEKSKVTCIKWLPNSMNLFLAGYSSGNIYLYDANNQTQPNTSPVFTKLYQDESFSLHINNHSAPSSVSTSNTPQSSNNTNTNSTPPRTKSAASTSYSDNNSNSFNNSKNQQQDKLVLLSSNQQPVQIAKNPLLKWTIGASNPSTDPSSSSNNNNTNNEQVFYNTSSNCVGVNGVNEFSFSPCGAYLAVVSQDGYMRVFSFSYQNNQQMQISLRCSMKSYFGGLLCVTWSPDGRYIATGGEDDLITLFSFIDMRVACRGRGHSSWINACSFDPWTCLTNNNTTTTTASVKQTKSKNNNENDESDLEEFHSGLKQLNLNHNNNDNNKKITTTKKNRTISTLSDLNYNHKSNDSIYYRLASCGQDNQICFWDLTEECLKEKILPNSRSRLTSLVQHQNNNSSSTNKTQSQTTNNSYQLPQIIIQPSDLLIESNKILNQQNQKDNNNHHHHHSTTSSIVSTARSLFSLKHNNDTSNKSNKIKNELTELNPTDLAISTNPATNSSKNSTSSSSTSGGISLTTSFFKKHKRNASLTNTGITNNGSNEIITNSSSSSSSSNSKNKSNKNNQNQITLNSYKKSSNTINLTENLTQSNNNANIIQSDNTIKKVNYDLTSTKTTSSFQTNNNNNNNSSFNLCPKLDEIPIIEPLICKRIANERLNSIVFKEDCFMVSTQDGYVFTWARPVSSTSGNNKSNQLIQLNNEFKMNTTSL